MFKSGTAITIAATLFASSAIAFDPNDVQKLNETNECTRCDLRNANLNGLRLNDAILFGANLGGAYLINPAFPK